MEKTAGLHPHICKYNSAVNKIIPVMTDYTN